MKTIRVPDVPVPTALLCWKQGASMERCDRRSGHGGKHTWEYAAEIERLRAQLVLKGIDPP